MKRKPLHDPPREIREAEAMAPRSRRGAVNKTRRRDTHRWTADDLERFLRENERHRGTGG